MKKEKGKNLKKEEVKVINEKKLVISASILVVSIIIIAFSLTWAYFTVGDSGKAAINDNKTAILNVDSNLKNASAINETEMALITPENVESEAKKVTFDVTNQDTSNVNAKYIVKLVDYSITKNLSSEYFKWKLVVNPGEDEQVFSGNFLQSDIPEGTTLTGVEENDKVSGLEKELVSEEEALTLNVGESDNLVFYVWLENTQSNNQLYLTNGEFRGKLSLEAYPVKP